MSQKNMVSALSIVFLLVLIAGCDAYTPAAVQPTFTSMPSPTESLAEIVEVNEIMCPCGASFLLRAWEDVNANRILDGSDEPLGGVSFDATWNRGEGTRIDARTGQSEHYYTKGHEIVTTNGSGEAELFVTGCFCHDPAALDLRIQVSQSPGWRLVTRDAWWSFGFESESASSPTATLDLITTTMDDGCVGFPCPHPILSVLRVRQAIAHCIDRRALIASVYPYVEDLEALLMDSFLAKAHWAYGGPYEDMPQYDPEAGMALLEEAGWTLSEGATVRQNADGMPLTLEFTTTTAQFRQTWSAVMIQDLAACGIEIKPRYMSASWWFGDTTGLARRDFELGAFAWVVQADPGGRTLYACDQILTPYNNWRGQNYMGWCNEVASAAVIKATNTVSREERVAAYDIVQQAFADDVVSVPLFQRVASEAWNVNIEGIHPDPTEFATANLHEWKRKDGGDTIVIGMTQEPDNLWATKSSQDSSALVRMAIGNERTYTQYGYDFQPGLQDPLSTIENGLASNNDLEVKAGDRLYDASGDLVVLEKGDRIIDRDGNEVEFDGTTPVAMKQLVVTYRHKQFTWSDGTPGSIADFELGQRIDCDSLFAGTSSVPCEFIQKVDWGTESLEYAITYLPGVQTPSYFLAPLTPYPSARVMSDSRALADVQAAIWQILPEINEMPLSWGPYRIVAWDKGKSITLERNPYYDGDVAIPNVIFVFLTERSQAVAQLLNGDVDYLDDSTLDAGAEVQTVIDAAKATGNIKYSIIASPTWEHLDINLDAK